MAVVIAVIPITVRVPAMPIFIPPTMAFPPATFASFTQLMPRMVRLPAVPAVVFDSLVQSVVCLDDAPLTAVIVMGEGTRRRAERQQANERGCCEQRPAQKPFFSHMNRHVLSILQ
jgi:hypothetical protein